MDDIITYLVVTCDYNSTIREAQCMMQLNLLHATFTFVLKIGGVIVVTSTNRVKEDFECLC